MGKVFFKFFCRLEFSFKRTFSLKMNTPLYTFIIVGWVQPPVILRICAPGFNSSFAFTSISSTLPTLPRVLSFIEITLKNTVLAILKIQLRAKLSLGFIYGFSPEISCNYFLRVEFIKTLQTKMCTLSCKILLVFCQLLLLDLARNTFVAFLK